MAGSESKLKNVLEAYEKIGVAFSGGVDSSFLLAVLVKQFGADRVVALTVKSPYIPEWEVSEAKEYAKNLVVRHEIIELEMPSVIRFNPKDRCYQCKKIVFDQIWTKARSLGCDVLCDGTNHDDLSDYRPGLRALEELSVISPLMLAGYTKDEIRLGLRAMGHEIWAKPPYACLLTRIPYDEEVKPEMLRQIEAAEFNLMQKGIKGVRVRHHGNIARIEIQKEELSKIFSMALMESINEDLKALGFEFVTLDLGGYQSGCYNVHVVSSNETGGSNESE